MNFAQRLKKHQDELRWLYMELYNNGDRYQELVTSMENFSKERAADLKKLDLKREQDPNWYRRGNMLGMTMYSDLFNGGVRGVMEKLGLPAQQENAYLHLMPLLKMPEGENDGGYAVEDFRQVDPRIGTNEDLQELTPSCANGGLACAWIS